jgi:hypothetical protein
VVFTILSFLTLPELYGKFKGADCKDGENVVCLWQLTVEEDKNMIKKTLILTAITFAAVAGLTGCSSAVPETGSMDVGSAKVWTASVKTSSGDVDCVLYQGSYAGTIQCDWANLGEAKAPKIKPGFVSVIQQNVSGRVVDCVSYSPVSSYGGGVDCNLPSVQK